MKHKLIIKCSCVQNATYIWHLFLIGLSGVLYMIVISDIAVQNVGFRRKNLWLATRVEKCHSALFFVFLRSDTKYATTREIRHHFTTQLLLLITFFSNVTRTSIAFLQHIIYTHLPSIYECLKSGILPLSERMFIIVKYLILARHGKCDS